MIFPFSRQNHLLYTFSLTIFFWALFDGVITYFTPILIIQRGFSNFEMGVIIVSSSLFGAILDLLLSRILKGSNYLRTLLMVIGISFFYPLTLWYSSHFLIYLLAMFVWGLYWDLYRFVSYDFVAQTTNPDNNCFSFSVIGTFRSIALVLAPLIAGFLVIDRVEMGSILIPSIFLIISCIFYVVLISHSPHFHSDSGRSHRHSFSWLKQIKNLFSLASHLVPFIILTVAMVAFDASIWTLGPLLSPFFPQIPNFSGILMTLYILPTLFSPLYINFFVSRLGKKRLAFLAFILSTIIFLPIFFTTSPYLIIFLFFLSSLVNSVSWPTVSGYFTDLVEVNPKYKEEYESLSDFSVNLGFIFGPLFVGFFSDRLSLSNSLGLIALMCLLVTTGFFYSYHKVISKN